MTDNQQMESHGEPVVIIGGGPAGLTSAYELTRLGRQPIVLEKRDKVGGISRTESYKGYHFDMGGHRFFTKADEVNEMWNEVLGDEFLERPRLSHIYYKQKFFNYPLKPINALINLGIFQAILAMLSYIRWQLFPYRVEETFEQWVTNRFGRRLFMTFFKTYTEKVWGISTSELKAEWAAQRIKDLSLKTAIVAMFFKPKTTIKTLIEQFHYPRFGPGMMWNAFQHKVEQRGGTVHLETQVLQINRCDNRIESVVIERNGQRELVRGSHFISSMPVSEFLKRMDPPPPERVLDAARHLHYRDFLTVCLIVNKPDLFKDNWIYVHDPAVQVGRIQNFKNWSPDMVPDPAMTSLGMEYFCNKGDTLWDMSDANLVELGRREIDRVGLARYEDVTDGAVFRVEYAYPVYDSEYRGYLDVIKDYMATLENVATVGRNGLHRYNNQDHSMLTGMLAVRNLLLGEQHDLWSINGEDEYHEEVKQPAPAATDDQREVVEVTDVVEQALVQFFPKLDPLSFGLAVGLTAGVLLSVATLVLLVQGGANVGDNLRLLGEFFPGYRVTLPGSVIGLLYGFLAGAIGGWTFAYLRNTIMYLSMAIADRRIEMNELRQVLDF